MDLNLKPNVILYFYFFYCCFITEIQHTLVHRSAVHNNKGILKMTIDDKLQGIYLGEKGVKKLPLAVVI